MEVMLISLILSLHFVYIHALKSYPVAYEYV